MSKIAFLFPGQGSQAIGMGSTLVENAPSVRSIFEQASTKLGWDVLKTCKEGPEDKLRQTEIAQPALYVTGFAASAVLQELGIQPEAVAGHSIGEYAALATAGVFSFEEGLALVQERARLMRDAANAHPGSMMAILGLSGEQVQAVCEEASSKGVCVAVNFNSPEQTVIAGDAVALEEVNRLAPGRGAKRVIPLNVAGAFHSPLMAEAAHGMKSVLSKISFKPARIPVAMNSDGIVHQATEEIQRQLELQLDHAVQWVPSIQSLRAQGIDSFIECGTGRVLTGLMRRIDRQAAAMDTDTWEAIQQVREALGASRKG